MGPSAHASMGNVKQAINGQVAASGVVTLDVSKVDTLRISLAEGFYVHTCPAGKKAFMPTQIFYQHLGEGGGTLHQEFILQIDNAANPQQPLLGNRQIPTKGLFKGRKLDDDDLSNFQSGIISVRMKDNQEISGEYSAYRNAHKKLDVLQHAAEKDEDRHNKLFNAQQEASSKKTEILIGFGSSLRTSSKKQKVMKGAEDAERGESSTKMGKTAATAERNRATSFATATTSHQPSAPARAPHHAPGAHTTGTFSRVSEGSDESLGEDDTDSSDEAKPIPSGRARYDPTYEPNKDEE
jgi:hypothetical protein